MLKPGRPKDTGGYDLNLAEPYIDDDGNPAVALIWNRRHLHLRTVEQWKEDEPKLGEYMESVFFPGYFHRWNYPSTPILPINAGDIRALHTDIMRCNDLYIEFPDSAWPSAFASWLMGSYLTEFMPRSPIIPIFAPTNCGKGQILDQIHYLGYRGKKYINPTPAILYRQANRWRMTFALDEIQDKNKENLTEIMNIVKGSFDGTPVPRYNPDTGEVDEFQTRGFVAISFKDRHPKEDIKNRGILLTMQQNTAHKVLVDGDTSENQGLRARLMGLRFRALTDREFIEEAIRAAQARGSPEALGFDRRPRDIAVSLLLPAVLSGSEDELIEVIRKSNTEAKDDNNTTFVARVHHRYQNLVEDTRWSERYIPVLTIRSGLEWDMQQDGELKDKEKLSTRRVTDAFKTLGYEIVRKTGNNPYIDRESKRNISAFQTNRNKYPVEKEAE